MNFFYSQISAARETLTCLNSVEELLYEFSEDERFHVLCQQREQLPVPHLAKLTDLLHHDGALVDGLGPQVLLKRVDPDLLLLDRGKHILSKKQPFINQSEL